MRVGPAEGTPQEISDFFENNGLDAANYFQKVDNPISVGWVAAPASLVLLAVLWLWQSIKTDAQYQWLAFLLGCLSSVWLAVSLQLRFRQPWVTGLGAVGCLAVLFVAFGVYSPSEAVEQLNKLRK